MQIGTDTLKNAPMVDMRIVNTRCYKTDVSLWRSNASVLEPKFVEKA